MSLRRHRPVLFLLLLALECMALQAQDEKADSVDAAHWNTALRLDLASPQWRDDLLTPLRYTGAGLFLRFAVARHTQSNEHNLQVRIRPAIAWNRYTHTAAAFQWGGHYTYLHRVDWLDHGNWNLRIGGIFAAQIDDIRFLQWDDSYLYWITIYAIGPAASLEHDLSDGRALEFSAELPLVGWLGRPPAKRFYKVDDLRFWSHFTLPHHHLSFTAFPDFLMLNARASYVTSATRSFRVVFEFAFRTTPEPRRVSLLEYLLGVEWTFGGT